MIGTGHGGQVKMVRDLANTQVTGATAAKDRNGDGGRRRGLKSPRDPYPVFLSADVL